MNNRDLKLVVVVLVVLAVAGAAWYFRNELLPQPKPPATAPPESAPAVGAAEEGPRYPITPPAAERERGELVDLPPLDDSDAYFLLEIADLFGADVGILLQEEAIIDRIVATVDNLPRDHVAEKIRPVGRLAEPFRVISATGDAPIYISPESYLRFDPLVSQLAAADIDAVVDAYRRFYPLFQQSYARLGYPDGYFNDRVIEVIDHLLATPEPPEPIPLVRPHVLYEFADPDLESLSSGQKVLLRMGQENAAAVKRVLLDLRAELARR